jgi:hypothetical protein
MYDDRPSVARRAPIAGAGAITSLDPVKVMETLGFKRWNSKHVSSGDNDVSDAAEPSAEDVKEEKQVSTFQQRLETLSYKEGKPNIQGITAELSEHASRAAASELRPAEHDETAPKEADDISANVAGSVFMSKEYVELIEHCWAQSPGDRPTADDVVWRLVGLIDEHIRRGADKSQVGDEWHD